MQRCNGIDRGKCLTRKRADLLKAIHGNKRGKHVNDGISITGSNPEKPTNAKHYQNWKNINWKVVVQHVNKLQTRIAKAIKAGKQNLVKRLTYVLTHSYYAKLLAVRKVTTNRGKRTPGVDGVLWLTSNEKLLAAESLTDRSYKAKPLRRVYIEKKGKSTKRPLGIPTMYDRAMQALYAFALYPIAETTGDTHSFGFRMGRSAQDAMEYIFTVTSRKWSPEWVLDADIKGCFDNISHEWLLKNIPMDKSILKQFLKAGFVFEEQLFPTEDGTPQGGIISPILANMTLDGLQETIEKRTKYTKVHLIRYADDMVITSPTKDSAQEIKAIVTEFLDERGLKLSEEKTHIVHINDGYDFLGQNIRKYAGKLIIKPSKKSIESLNDKLHEIILDRGLALSQEDLIRRLNPILRGWANYHKYVCSSQTFERIAFDLFHKLWRWATRRHAHKSKAWIKHKYWHSKGNQKWNFSCESNEIFAIERVKIERRSQLKTAMNPFLNRKYFLNRKDSIVRH